MRNIFLKLAATTAIVSITSTALAAPKGGVVTSGQAQIVQQGKTTNINQSSQSVDINWKDFSSAANETINFNQPGASAIAFNRVTGGVPSYLAGALNSNGRVVIINDSGITFTKGSRTNVGALIATTAKNFTLDPSDPTGSTANFSGATKAIVNNGIIDSPNGFVYMAAPEVTNTGTITANNGNIGLYGVSEGQMGLTGAPASNVGMLIPNPNDSRINYQVNNTGKLVAKSGNISIYTQPTTAEMNSGVINLNGVVDVSSLTPNGNAGLLLAYAGNNLNTNGTIKADGIKNGNGGTVELSAGSYNNGIVTTNPDGTINYTPGGIATNGEVNIGKTANISANSGTESGQGGYMEIRGTSNITDAGHITGNGSDTGRSAYINIESGDAEKVDPGSNANVTLTKSAVITNNGNKSIYVDNSGNQYGDLGQVGIIGDTVSIAGTIKSNGTKNGDGGQIYITSNQHDINIKDSALLVADGGQNAAYGGRISLYADQSANVDGNIHTSGGTYGNGGNIEINSGVLNSTNIVGPGDINIGKTSKISSVSGTTSGYGGQIELSSSNNINIDGDLNVNALKNNGNGLIYASAGTLNNPGNIAVGKTSTLSADAGTVSGNGGTVVLTSNHNVVIDPNAKILARGGTLDGNGGDVVLTSRPVYGDYSGKVVAANQKNIDVYSRDPSGQYGSVIINQPIPTITVGGLQTE